MTHQLVQAARYFESQDMSQLLYSKLHHFSLKGRQITFPSTFRYFGVNRRLGKNNTALAELCKFVESQHRRTGQFLITHQPGASEVSDGMGSNHSLPAARIRH